MITGTLYSFFGLYSKAPPLSEASVHVLQSIPLATFTYRNIYLKLNHSIYEPVSISMDFEETTVCVQENQLV